MNDFDYDCLQKKRIARNAHNHVNARRGKCKLPHEYLSAKERKALNGEVKTYNLKGPMPYTTFASMPQDLQDQYVTFLRTEMQATNAMIGEMWGYKASWVSRLLQCHSNHPATGHHICKAARDDRDAKWKEFLGKTDEPVEGPKKPIEEPMKSVEPAIYHDAPTTAWADFKATMHAFRVSFNYVHSWEELYALIKQYPFPEKRAAWIGVEVQ